MPEGGIIKLIAENITVQENETIDSNYVKISIIDQGIGIPAELLPKIFDPYFTTKQKGNGLGLATSYSIINKHNGHITVESKIGEGTSFFIFLPASKKVTSFKKVDKETPVLGKGRVLVMDDDELVRKTVGNMLKRIGYEVYFAKDGDEAIKKYKTALKINKPFDAVIIDLTIPGGMGGEKTIRNLLQIDAHVKAIVSSGYSTNPIMADFTRYGFCGIVTKPYKIKELSEVLHNVTS